jgi:very-short-patch-repair endonuclease
MRVAEVNPNLQEFCGMQLPNRPPAYRCPDHGWVSVHRLRISAHKQEIFEANLERIRARPDCDPDKAWQNAYMITSPIEAELLGALRFYGMRPEIQRPIGPFVADFCFVSDGFVVEVDGRDWHKRERDLRRDARLLELGFRTKRFPASEVWADPVACARRVRDELESLRRWRERSAA